MVSKISRKDLRLIVDTFLECYIETMGKDTSFRMTDSKKILIENEIPYQEFFNNSDVPGGSTLGNLSNQQYSLKSVDMGAAQLAMHSPYETGGTKDTYYMIAAMKAFLKR